MMLKVWGTFCLFAYLVMVMFLPLLTSPAIGSAGLATGLVLGKASCKSGHTPDSFRKVEYVKNYDGDTLTVNIPNVHALLGQKIGVRVNGVDTPELRTDDVCEKAMGIKAKEFVAKLCANAKRIDLKDVSRGKYFRIVADVVCDGKSVSKELIANGLAYPYDGGTKKKVDWCK